MILDRTVMTYNDRTAPMKTADRCCLILSTAAMKNVLSPISVAKIIATPDVNAFQNPPLYFGKKNDVIPPEDDGNSSAINGQPIVYSSTLNIES